LCDLEDSWESGELDHETATALVGRCYRSAEHHWVGVVESYTYLRATLLQ
jgi:hypothetical protein